MAARPAGAALASSATRATIAAIAAPQNALGITCGLGATPDSGSLRRPIGSVFVCMTLTLLRGEIEGVRQLEGAIRVPAGQIALLVADVRNDPEAPLLSFALAALL